MYSRKAGGCLPFFSSPLSKIFPCKNAELEKKFATRPSPLSGRGHGCFISPRLVGTECSARERVIRYFGFPSKATGHTLCNHLSYPTKALPRPVERQKDQKPGSSKLSGTHPDKRTRCNNIILHGNDPTRHLPRPVERQKDQKPGSSKLSGTHPDKRTRCNNIILHGNDPTRHLPRPQTGQKTLQHHNKHRS